MDERFCQNCGFSHDCKKVYRQLGSATGPSVALKATVAFLLPITVFIAALGVFDKILVDVDVSEQVKNAAAAAIAAIVAFVAVILTKNTKYGS